MIQGRGFTEWAEQIVVGRVFEADIRRFSRHYDGSDGAVIGLAFAAQFDTVEEAKDTGSFDVVDERFLSTPSVCWSRVSDSWAESCLITPSVDYNSIEFLVHTLYTASSAP